MTISAGILTDVNDDGAAAPMWGTWEELLLAFAVNRHGTGAWDSIAEELQKRSSEPARPVTAQNCRLKYMDLRRRFVMQNGDLADDIPEDKSKEDESVTLLEELRRLRVAELRREVEHYDLNIESLELKMKRMEEEREKKDPDLEKGSEGNRGAESESEPANGGEPVAGEDSEKDQLSMNESNSTDLGAEKLRTVENENEPVQTGRPIEEPAELKTEPDGKLVRDREDSCNGSSNSIEKEPDRETKAATVSVSADLVESEAESKGGGGEEATKENSDVQSSASRSREEKEGSEKVRRVITSGDGRDHEDQSRAVKELSAESQRLVDFLQIIRSHKFGCVFERRLRSQESSKYQKLILQHVDLETVETRLKEGWYSGNTSKFFRDLLLLVNNALVFFNKTSSETKAATEVRKLISKEIFQKSTKSDSSSGKQVSPQSLSMTKKEDPPAQSLLLKPSISESIKVCRSKRSSIAAKASASDKKNERSSLLDDEKDSNLLSQPSSNADEPKITKKRTRDRFSLVSTGSKKTGKIPAKNNGNKNPAVEKQQGKVAPSSQQSDPKAENKKNQSADSKKRGAANFLNRMKQGSSTKNSTLLDALKNTPLTSESGQGGSESKKNDNAKRSEKKEQVSRRIAETRHTKEKDSPEKKNIGRPPKRGAAPPSAVGKRGRGGEAESSGSKQPKKRSRKL